MGRIPVTRVLFVFTVLVLLLPRLGHAQRSFGVLWEVPDDNEKALQELDRFEELNIRYLEIDKIVSDPLWDSIQKRDFRVYIQVPVRFPVVATFASPDSSLVETYQQFLTAYGDRDIEAIGAFAYGQTGDPLFVSAVAPYADQLRSSLSQPIYFKDWNYRAQAVDSLFDFKVTKAEVTRNFRQVADSTFLSAHAFVYRPSSELRDRITPLKWFIQKTAVKPDAILFFEGDWLLDFTNRHKTARQTLVQYATYPDAVFPLPDETLPEGSSHGAIVLILLILWGTVALTYSFIPTYRRSLFRYYLSHTFFIEDVMERHIRSVLPSLILLIQHAVLGGIMLYCAASVYLSVSGMKVLFFYFPWLNPFSWDSYLSFFLIGSLITLGFEIFSLLWLYIVNRKVGHLSQISILYAWPFHLNLVIATITLTMLMAGSSLFGLVLFFSLFLLVFLLAFPITAYDTGLNIKKFKWLYGLGTIGLYCLLLAGGLLAVFTSSYLLNILNLAIVIS